MTKIAIVCVCYNSYNHLFEYSRSLSISMKCTKDIEVKFIVVDNSTIETDLNIIDSIGKMLPSWSYLKSDNVGYFPAIEKGMCGIENCEEYDYWVVSNVDLRVDPAFFQQIKNLHISSDVGVVAPAIISFSRKVDLNPKIIFRPTRYSLIKNVFLFKYPFIFKLFSLLSNFRSKYIRKPFLEGCSIYAPHGSFIIFTRKYFEYGGIFSYPRFLFGEEVYIGEECLRIGCEVRYDPSIIVYDIEHGSTSLEKTSFIACEHVKSLKYLISKYF